MPPFLVLRTDKIVNSHRNDIFKCCVNDLLTVFILAIHLTISPWNWFCIAVYRIDAFMKATITVMNSDSITR